MRLYELDELVEFRKTPCADVLDAIGGLQKPPPISEVETPMDTKWIHADGRLAIQLYPDAVFQSTFAAPDESGYGVGNIIPKMHDVEVWFWMVVALRHGRWCARHLYRKDISQWPSDEVMENTRLPNVYRELDRSTLFINWEILNVEMPFSDALWRIIAFRTTKNVDLFQTIASNIWAFRANPQMHAEIIHHELSNPIDSINQGELNRINMIDFEIICDMINDLSAKLQQTSMLTQEEIVRHLLVVPGVSAYTAYQIMLDLCTYCVWRNGPMCVVHGEPHIVVSKLAANMLYKMGVCRQTGESRRAIIQLHNDQSECLRSLGADFFYPYDAQTGKCWMLSVYNIEHSLRMFALWMQARQTIFQKGYVPTPFVPATNVWRPNQPIPPYWLTNEAS